MIARIWNGKTKATDFDSYSVFLKQVVIPDYQKTPGFRGLAFLRSQDDHQAHFKLITYWDNLLAVKAFAGSDYTKAKYYPEDRHFLLNFEGEVEHFEVFENI